MKQETLLKVIELKLALLGNWNHLLQYMKKEKREVGHKQVEGLLIEIVKLISKIK